jgi:hypothetical protein
MSAKLIPDRAGIRKLERKSSLALNLTADLLAQRIDPQVPFKTGALAQSAFQHGRRIRDYKDTDIVKFIAYTAPYATKVYYGENLNFTRDKHPQARAYWGREDMANTMLIERIYKRAYQIVGGE